MNSPPVSLVFARFQWIGTGRSLVVKLVALVAVVATPAVAIAQQYEGLPFKRRVGDRVTVQRILKGETPLQGNEERFDLFFREFVFAEMAPSDPQKLNGIGNARAKFRTQYLTSRTLIDPRATAELNRIAMETMTSIIDGNFHPGVKYNALLLVGDLDQKPGQDGSNGSPPVPLPEASDYLLSMLDADKRPGDESLKDALLMSTLIGLARHAKYGLTDDQKAALTPKMLELVKQQEPPPGRLPDVHVWFRARAADVLGALGEPGSGNEVATALQSLFNEEEASNNQRCWAALAMGQLTFDPSTEELASALVLDIGDFAVLACTEEMETGARNMNDATRPGGRSRSFARGGGGGGGKEGDEGREGKEGRERRSPQPRGQSGARTAQSPRRSRASAARGQARGKGERDERGSRPVPKPVVDTVFPRRELAHQLDCASEALQAVEQGAPAPEKELAVTLMKQIASARKALEDQYMEDIELIVKLDQARNAMQTALADARAVAGGAEEPGEGGDADDVDELLEEPLETASN